MIIRWINILCVAVVVTILVGCGGDSPPKATVISLAQRCTLAGIRAKHFPDPREWGEWKVGADGRRTRSMPGVEEDQFSITNSFTQEANGEKVYCYDVKWQYGASGRNYNSYRISVAKRGNAVEVIDFKAL